MHQLNTIQVSIAEILMSLMCDNDIADLLTKTIYKDFIGSGEPEVIIHSHYEGLPAISLLEKDLVFDSQSVWSLYELNGKQVFVLKSPWSEPNPYRVALFEPEFCRGEIHNPVRDSVDISKDSVSNPLEYPLSEILMIALLSRGRGVMSHACGIDDDGRGFLFAGNSTHGKTTMARLWKEQATVLNDDRIVIRKKDGQYWMYGTPWHGDYDQVAPHGVPLEKILFLNHGSENTASQVQGVRAASKLLARAFPPLWDQAGMEFTLGFCDDLVASVPCYELDFVPRGEIVDYVRCLN